MSVRKQTILSANDGFTAKSKKSKNKKKLRAAQKMPTAVSKQLMKIVLVLQLPT